MIEPQGEGPWAFLRWAIGWPVERLRRFLAADRWTKGFVLLLLCWIMGVGSVALLRYYTFRTNAFDLGIFNQAFATTLQGRLFYETPDLRVIPSGSFLGTHFNLLMFALLPLYALFPRPETLLIVQMTFVGLGAVPVWLISNHALGRRSASLLLSAAYLFNPGVLSLALYDFHLEGFLPFFLGMLFVSFLMRRWRTYFVFLALSLMTLDFASVLIIAISVAHLLRGMRSESRVGNRWRMPRVSLELGVDERKVLGATVLLSPLVLLLTLQASAYFSGTSEDAGSIAAGFLQLQAFTDRRIGLLAQFWVILFGALLFLPLLSPKNLAMILPWMGLTLFLGPVTWFLIGYQYGGAFVAPFLVWATVFGLRKMDLTLATRYLLPAVLVLSVSLSPLNPAMQGGLPGINYEQGLPVPTARDGILRQAIALIPERASVLTQNNLFPQVSNRVEAYVYLTTNDTPVEFVLADMSSRWFRERIWGEQSMSQWLPYFLRTGEYGVLIYADEVVLLQKDYSGPLVVQDQTEYRYDYRTLTSGAASLVSDPTSESGGVLLFDSMGGTGQAFWYGPYRQFPPGSYAVTFWMKKSPAATGNLSLDVSYVVNESAEVMLANRDVSAADFPSPDVWTPFEVRFSHHPENLFTSLLEFRGTNASGGPFYLDYVHVMYVGPP